MLEMLTSSRMLIFFSTIAFMFVSTNTASYEKILADIVLNKGLDIFQIVRRYRYPLETHRVVTEDGYIIEMHRIPYGHAKINKTNRPAVLIIPGIDCSSEDFVNTGNISLAFTLSEAGYDVWIYNTRGIRWSRTHLSMSPNNRDFWMFSWHETGIYDLPACIDHVIDVTKQDKIFFIGYSQGTTNYAVLMSERPEYNEKIRLAIFLATVVHTVHNKHAMLLYLAKHYNTLKRYLEIFGLYEIRRGMTRQLCTNLMFICQFAFYLIFGYETEQIDEKFLPVIINNPSDNVPTGFLEHYAQLFTTKEFKKMDYGRADNLVRYGSEDPPEYDLSKITSPIALFCGRNDIFATCEDSADLANELPNVVLNYVVPYEMWTHCDFLWGRDAPELVYGRMFQLMKEY